MLGSCRYRSVNSDESELSRTVLDPIYRSANPDYLGCLNPGWIPDTGLLTLMNLSCLDPCLIPDTGLQTLIIWAVLIQVGSCRYRSINPDESELSRSMLDPRYRSANPDVYGLS